MEELNQVQEVGANTETGTNESDENLFAGLTPSDEESTPAETEEGKKVDGSESSAESNEAKENKESTETKPFITVKYDKQDRGLTQEETVEYAQKGMNYDRIMDKYNALNAPLEKLAKMNGMKVEEYLGKLNDAQLETKIREEVNALKKEYPDYDDKFVRELAERRAKENQNSLIQEIEREQNMQADAMQEAVQKDIEIFKREFPNVNLEDIKNNQEILDSIRDGHSLVSAYYKHLNKINAEQKSKEEAQAKIDKQNEENKKKSLGSTTNVGAEEETDETRFLKAMDSI